MPKGDMDSIYYHVRRYTGENQYELKWAKNVKNSLNKWRNITIYEDNNYATVRECGNVFEWELPKHMFGEYLKN